MAQQWKAVEGAAKNDSGEYQALVGGKWQPVAGAAKNDAGEYMALMDDAPAARPTRSLSDVATDTGIDAVRGVVGAGESVVGLADIATGNAAGKALSKIGYDPAATHKTLSAGYSDQRKAADQNVHNAKGFVETLDALIDNPSSAVGTIVQSAPLSLSGAAVVRAAATKMLAGAGIGVGTAAATEFLKRPDVAIKLLAIGGATEGAMTAGSIEEQGRQAGREYTDTVLPALAGGAITGAIGFGSSKIPGFRDAEVAAATAGMGVANKAGLIAAGKEIAKSGFKEGVLEELPQSAQEQVFTNLALGKPWNEGVGESAAQGLIAGMGTGVGMTTYSETANRMAGANPQSAGAALGNALQSEIDGSQFDQRSITEDALRALSPTGKLPAPLTAKAAEASARQKSIVTGQPHQVIEHPAEAGKFTAVPAAVAQDVEQKSAAIQLDIPTEDAAMLQQAEEFGQAAAPVDHFANGVTPEALDSLFAESRAKAAAKVAQHIAAPTTPIQEIAPATVAQYDTPAVSANLADIIPINPIDAAAHDAATSPLNDLPEPTQAQKEAGNYKKAHIKLHGLDIAIENPKGSERSGIDPNGDAWSVALQSEPSGKKPTKVIVQPEIKLGENIPPNIQQSPATPIPVSAPRRDVLTPPATKITRTSSGKLAFSGYTKQQIQDAVDSIHSLAVAKATKKTKNKSPNEIKAALAQAEFKPKIHEADAKGQIIVQARKGQNFVEFGKPHEHALRAELSISAVLKPKRKVALPKTMSMLQFVASIGGFDRASIAAEFGRLDDMKEHKSGIFGTPAFRVTGGRSWDDIGEALAEAGYLPKNEHGQYDKSDLEDRLNAELSGNKQYKDGDVIGNVEAEKTNSEMDELRAEADSIGIDWTKYKTADDLWVAITNKRDELSDAEAELKGELLAENDVDTDFDFGTPMSAAQTEAWLEGIDNAQGNEEQVNGTPAGEQGEGNQLGGERGSAQGEAQRQDAGRADGGEFALRGQTNEELVQQESAQAAQKAAQRAEEDAAKAEQAKKDQAALDAKKKAYAENSDNFVFGESKKDAVKPMGSLFDQPSKPAAPTDTQFANNKIFTQSAVDAARARLKKKLGTLNSAIDPELLQDGMTLAGAHIEAGARSFAAYSKAMIDDLGDAIKPYLRSLYESVRHYPRLETDGMTSSADIDAIATHQESAAVATTPDAPKSEGTHFAAGQAAFNLGQPRVLPSYFTVKTGKNPKDWYRGWDAANIDAKPNVLTSNTPTGDTLIGKNADGVAIYADKDGVRYFTSKGIKIQEAVEFVPYRAGNGTTGYKPVATERKDEYKSVEELGTVDKQGAKAHSETTGGTENARPTHTESLPGRDQENDPQGRSSGDRAGESLDSGLAGKGDGSDSGERVSDGIRVPGGTGAQHSAGLRGQEGIQPSDADGAVPSVRDSANAADGIESNVDHTITDADEIGSGGLVAKFRDNVAAIKILKALDTESRAATPEERKELARYVGFGALKGVFDKNNKQWNKQYAELRELLNDEEYDSARASVLNAHYTSKPVVDAMFSAVKRFGFSGGRFLEPSVGSGNFFGMMPAAISKASQLHGVELDLLTGKLVKAIYPKASIAVTTGFQHYQVPSGYFDIAMGNPPFGSEPIIDRERSEYSGFSIHNYFIARMIDKVRDGGIVPVIVSHNFMDATNPKTREWIAQRANLIAAVRLPNTAFKGNAGTEVVTDILFFQKTATPEKSPAWVDASDIELPNAKSGDKSIFSVNRYFTANPRNILGNPANIVTNHGNTYTVDPSGNLTKQLAEFVETLPENIYKPIERTINELDSADNTIPAGVKQGSYFVNDKGEVKQRGQDIAGAQTSTAWEPKNETAMARMKGMILLRNQLRTQMRMERDPAFGVKMIESHRAALSKSYDEFHKKYRFVNSQVNSNIFMDDTEYALLQAIEFDYDKGVSKATALRNGLEERAPSAKKADILERRVLFPFAEQMNVTSANDALLASLDAKGRIDLDYMESAYGKSKDEIIKELGDMLYLDPATGDHVMADEYLSGDVKTKLAVAKKSADENHEYSRNVKALEKVIPADKLPSEIYASLGAGWIPADTFMEFSNEITGGASVLAYVRATAQWLGDMTNGGDVGKMSSDYGTKDLTSFDLLKLTMNGKAPEVKMKIMRDGKEALVTDVEATEAAREKVSKIKQTWESWVWNDGARAEKLAALFNEKHNRTVNREYNGDHLVLHGSNPAITLRKHQKSAVWRGIQDRNLLLDHAVGAGKTFVGAAIIMEYKRLGIARKPILVVPNHLTTQWRSEFARMYPAANVLAANPEDFNKANRQRMFSKIALGEYDAVIIGHSSLTKIGLDPAIEEGIYKEQIDEIANAIEAMKSERGDKGIVRDMEKIKSNLEAKVEKLRALAGVRDKVVTFDELGIDGMFVDEMHEFKNLFFVTQMQHVSGLGNPKGSGKAFDLFAKVRWLTKTYGEKVPFITATGTPVSNSLSEMFTMQRYMKYDELKRDGLHLFDSWSRMYGDVESLYEVAPSGVGYRISQRFSKFKNLPSLMAHYRTFADTVTLQDLKDQAKEEGKVFPVPKITSGKPENIVAQRSNAQRDFFGVPVVRKDESGNTVFAMNHSTAKIEQNKDAKWILSDGHTSASFDTKEDAELALVEKSLTPTLDLDPNSLLGQFGNLAQLTRETKGKINALSLTSLASKAGLDMRIINPGAEDFAGSKINKAVGKMMDIYQQWSKDNGAQLVFCDSSIPVSARASMATKDRRLFVLDDQGLLTHKNGTLHTVEGFEGFPFYLVRTIDRGSPSISVYDPVSGARIKGDLANKAEAKEWVSEFLSKDANRDRWYEARDAKEPITAEQMAEYRSENDLELAEDGSNEVSMDDIEGVAGASQFSVYDDIKAKLVERGVPENQIAFIHDYDTPAKKQALFKSVNRGDVRFLFGSTPKLGAGTNVQERLVGLHHIDAPWRPSDLEQREGRIIRQENKLYARDPNGFEVFIGRYATEQTYDTRRWQLLEHKASGIEQLRKYSGQIEIEDVAGEASNSADMKAAASGNPLILEETKLRTEVKRLTSLQKAHGDGKYSMQRKLSHERNRVETWLPGRIADLESAIKPAAANPIPAEKGAIPLIEIEGKKIPSREKAEAKIAEAVTMVRTGFAKSKDIYYRGVKFTIEQSFGVLSVESITGTVASYGEKDGVSPSGMLTRFSNYIDSLEQRKATVLADLEQAKKDISSIESRMDAPFEDIETLAAAQQKHGIIQRKLMKSSQIDAVPAEQRAAFNAEIAERKKALEELGYEKALKEMDSDTKFSQSATPSSNPQTVASVTKSTAKLRARWLGFRRVKIVQSVKEVPNEIYLRALRALKPIDQGTEGFYDPKTNSVYLIADNIASPERAAWVAVHEVVGHGGLRMLDVKVAEHIDTLAKNTTVAKLSHAIAVDRGETFDRATHTEEAIAELAAAYFTNGEKALLDRYGVKSAVVVQDGLRGMVQRIIEAIRRVLAVAIGKKIDAVSDAEVRSVINAALRAVEGAEQADGYGEPGYALASNSKGGRGELSGKAFARMVTEEFVAENDPAFIHAVSNSNSLEGVLNDIADTEYHGEHTRMDERDESGADHRYVFTTPDSTTFHVYETDAGRVWIDVSRLETGTVGQAIYAAVANYAYNTHKVFGGDPAGLSKAAMIRRTSNMLSSALRFGTTRHLDAAKEQIDGDIENGIEPLNWRGTDIDKIEALIHTFVSSIQTQHPVIKGYRYDFQTAQFSDAQGRPVTGAAISANLGRDARAGERTARRAVFLQALMDSTGEGVGQRSGILEQVLRWGEGSSNPDNLNALFSTSLNQADAPLSSRAPSSTPTLNLNTTAAQPANSSIPEETEFQTRQRQVQDKMNRFKVLQAWIKDKGVKLTDKANVHEVENLMHAKIANQTQDFRDQVEAPLLERAAKAGFTLEQIADYLEAQHIPEANARMRDIHQDANATANGISDTEANATLAQFQSMPKFADFKTLADEFRAIGDETLDMRLREGLISREQYDAYKATFKHWVPLRGDGKKPGVGKGLSVNAKEKRRLGHSERDNGEYIIENLLMDRERAIYQIEHNRVVKSIIQFALEAKEPDMITVGKPEKRQVLKNQTVFEVQHKGKMIRAFSSENDAKAFINQAIALSSQNKGGGMARSNFAIAKTSDPIVVMQASPMLAENEIQGYVAGHTIRIQLNDELLARAATNMGVDQLNMLLSAARTINNGLSKIYTAYSPDFIFRNATRDFIAGTINLTGDMGVKMAGKIYLNYGKAAKELFIARNDPRKSVWVQKYRAAGGNTGAAYLSDIERVGNDAVAAMHEHMKTRDVYRTMHDKLIAEGRSEKYAHLSAAWRSGVSALGATPVVGHFLTMIEHLNAVTENALRLATYMTLVQNGYTEQKAAAAAKNSTVNFNRKGEISNVAGSLWLFFNPSVQGSSRMFGSLLKSEYKGQAQAMAGMLAFAAFALDELGRGGDDEDERKWKNIPDYVKDHNMILKFGDLQWTIPVPYEFAPFHVLGNSISDAVHGESGWKSAIKVLKSIVDNTTPLGDPFTGDGKDGANLFQMMPTLVKMALAPHENENSFGAPIQPEKASYSKNKPDSQNMFRNTKGTLYSGAAEWMNEATGGSKYQPGGVDVSPETLKFWVSSLTGGTGRFVIDSIGAVYGATEGVAPDLRSTPIARVFVREPSVADARSRFWEAANEAKQAADAFAMAKKGHDGSAMKEIRESDNDLILLSRFADRIGKAAAKKRDLIDQIRMDDQIPLAQKREQMKEIEQKEQEYYDRFLKVFDQKQKARKDKAA